jgi:hypothetical protein
MVLKGKGSGQKPEGVGFTGPHCAMAKRIAPCSWWRRITLRVRRETGKE